MVVAAGAGEVVAATAQEDILVCNFVDIEDNEVVVASEGLKANERK